MSGLRVESLGGLAVRLGGRPVPAAGEGTAAGRALAALLVAGGVLPLDALAARLRPGEPPDPALAREAVADLARALDDGGATRAAVLPDGTARLLLRTGDRWDLAQLRIWAGALRAAPPELAPLASSRAEALCRGPLLPSEMDATWLIEARWEADALQREVLGTAADLLERRGECSAAGQRRRRLLALAC
jgi:DNA-binding SARP family transcriptional activator